MKNIFVVIFLCGAAMGCQTSEEMASYNKKEFAVGGHVVGTLPDGREVTRYRIYRDATSIDTIYVIDEVITVNSREGKHDHVNVIINNKKYVPLESLEVEE